MLEVKQVLIPTDLSEAARPAAVRGVHLARQFDAHVHLLTVVLLAEGAPLYPVFTLPPDSQKLYDEMTRSAQKRLEEIARELGIEPQRVTITVAHGNFAAPSILEYAREHDIDLIAMGTHGRRGFRHFLLGSVAEEVVRKAACPVATFRPDVPAEPRRPERILAALDLSEHSASVVEHARALAELYHASVDFVHVLPQPHYPAYYELGASALLFTDLEETQDKVVDAMQELVRKTKGPAGEYSFSVLKGRAELEIVRFAKERRSDLIVLASHGLTGLSHVLLGSVAEKVLRQADCPVLTVHAAGKSWIG